MKKAKFAMIFHCYQPVSNFEEVIEKAYATAYLPLLETLKDFSGIKVCFHFSGNILEWLEQKHPEYIVKLNDLILSGNVELLAGGYSEPIMSMIPEYDRHGQIVLNKGIMERLFDVSASGAWVSERVWDPTLIRTLSRENISYTIVDDHHFIKAGLCDDMVYKPCRVRSGDDSIVLFPGHSFLRYSIPFRDPDETINYFKNALDSNSTEDLCFFFADDGEKFGSWPHTHRHVYKKGWLSSFLKKLEDNSDWIETLTCSEILEDIVPEDVKEIPHSSYKEMMSWCNGNFSNFFKKYPEAGRMQRRMVKVSENIESARPYLADEQFYSAQKELFKAQSNCAYWHGAFGGVYLPHLRSGVYEHLLKAQGIVDKSIQKGKAPLRVFENYKDTENSETIITNSFLELYTTPDRGGRLCELDYKRQKLNLLNTIRRSHEKYHNKLDSGYFSKIRKARAAVKKGIDADIHDILGVAQHGLKRFLNYDDYERDSFLTHVFRPECFWPELGKKRSSDNGFLTGKYSSSIVTGRDQIKQVFSRRGTVGFSHENVSDIEVVKEIEISHNPVVFFSQKLIDHSENSHNLGMASEFNLMIWDKHFIAKPRRICVDKIYLKDMYSGTELDFRFNEKCRIFTYPVYSINETEMGLCRTFQGISLVIGKDNREELGKNEYMLQFSLTIR